jgi:hypothetical protein
MPIKTDNSTTLKQLPRIFVFISLLSISRESAKQESLITKISNASQHRKGGIYHNFDLLIPVKASENSDVFSMLEMRQE